jgi:ribosomal protein L40E
MDMAWTHAAREPIVARWACRRCYTVNAIGAQFCSDCGLTPRLAPTEAALPQAGWFAANGRRLIAMEFILIAVVAMAFMGLQLIR